MAEVVRKKSQHKPKVADMSKKDQLLQKDGASSRNEEEPHPTQNVEFLPEKHEVNKQLEQHTHSPLPGQQVLGASRMRRMRRRSTTFPQASGPQACCCCRRDSFSSFSKLCRTTMRIAPARHLVRTVVARCQNELLDSSLSHLQSSPNRGSSRSLNIFTIFNKEARAKEQVRLTDELNRGYFDDIRELKKTGGKFGIAARNLVPIAAAPKFPSLIVQSPGGTPAFELPIQEGQNHVGPTLLCVAFRASAQAMVESWSKPFSKMFKPNNGIQIFEVSVIESWLLSLKPIRSLLLRTVRDAEPPAATLVGEEVQILLQRKVAYSFGDTYFFRKTLGIPNLLSGYVFLLDNKGRVRWRASGMATAEELTSMESCTLRLLEEQSPKAHQSDSQQQIAQHSSDRR